LGHTQAVPIFVQPETPVRNFTSPRPNTPVALVNVIETESPLSNQEEDGSNVSPMPGVPVSPNHSGDGREEPGSPESDYGTFYQWILDGSLSGRPNIQRVAPTTRAFDSFRGLREELHQHLAET
jgi:hypothetical protein